MFLTSCSYPDIDNVPNFEDIKLSKDEIKSYCMTFSSDKKSIDKCVKDYKEKNNYE